MHLSDTENKRIVYLAVELCLPLTQGLKYFVTLSLNTETPVKVELVLNSVTFESGTYLKSNIVTFESGTCL